MLIALVIRMLCSRWYLCHRIGVPLLIGLLSTEAMGQERLSEPHQAPTPDASPLQPMVGTWSMSFKTADGKPSKMTMGIVRASGLTVEGFFEGKWGEGRLRSAIYATLDTQTGRLVFSTIELRTNLAGGAFAINAILSPDKHTITLGVGETATWVNASIPAVPVELQAVVTPPHDRARLYQQISMDYVVRSTKVFHGSDRNRVLGLKASSDPHVAQFAGLVVDKYDKTTAIIARLSGDAKQRNARLPSDVSVAMLDLLNSVAEERSGVGALVAFMNSDAVRGRASASRLNFMLLIENMLNATVACKEIRRSHEARNAKPLATTFSKTYGVSDRFAQVTLVNRSSAPLTDCMVIVRSTIDKGRVEAYGQKYFQGVGGTLALCGLIGIDVDQAVAADRASLAYLAMDRYANFYVPVWNSDTPITFSLGIPLDNLQHFADGVQLWIGCEEGSTEQALDIAALRRLSLPGSK